MGIDSASGHPAMDYAEHQRTYAGFITAAKIGIAAMVVLLGGMYVFLVR